jgi:hypothetical protein
MKLSRYGITAVAGQGPRGLVAADAELSSVPRDTYVPFTEPDAHGAGNCAREV